MVRSFFLKVCAFLGLAVFFCGAVPLAVVVCSIILE